MYGKITNVFNSRVILGVALASSLVFGFYVESNKRDYLTKSEAINKRHERLINYLATEVSKNQPEIFKLYDIANDQAELAKDLSCLFPDNVDIILLDTTQQIEKAPDKAKLREKLLELIYQQRKQEEVERNRNATKDINVSLQKN